MKFWTNSSTATKVGYIILIFIALAVVAMFWNTWASSESHVVHSGMVLVH